MICISMTVTTVSCRIYTIKKVNATLYRFQYICRSTNSHQICRFIFRQIRHCLFNNIIHFCMTFAYRKSSKRITIKI